MIRLACVLGVVVGFGIAAVTTYRPQAQAVGQQRLRGLVITVGNTVQIVNIPAFRRRLPGTDEKEIECHAYALSLPVVCCQGRWYMANGDDSSVAK